MTEQEKLLIRLKEYMDNEGYLYETPYLSKANTESVIVALEKQIPKKPLIVKNMMTKREYKACPVCEHQLVPHSTTFCDWCGQCVKWSVEE